ncbi:uncharacterized protein LOC121263354 [Juglans microcarpa x Juglans regia]|uniref:uncharacterized protein LOC121263354 n=1 Tax=Juglans microcarpa x Juglans regia TaxID=2249226 RepID=UPI001B7DE765|nr:uncharacterized protein LOC121263354 [Juglans microcarpa x Juglans regia]
MEDASKKRKYCLHHDDDVEEDDEQKMEKFFALIRNIQEARDQRVRSNGPDVIKGSIDHKRSKMNKVIEEEKKIKIVTEVWKPSFEPEDFMEKVAGAQLKTVLVLLKFKKLIRKKKKKKKKKVY